MTDPADVLADRIRALLLSRGIDPETCWVSDMQVQYTANEHSSILQVTPMDIPFTPVLPLDKPR